MRNIKYLAYIIQASAPLISWEQCVRLAVLEMPRYFGNAANILAKYHGLQFICTMEFFRTAERLYNYTP